MKVIARMLSGMLVAALLAGCGGGGSSSGSGTGGGGGVTPTISNLTIEAGADPKTIEFAWDVANGGSVDHYRLEVDPDGSGTWNEADATDITVTNHALAIPVHLTDWLNAKFRVVAENASDNILATSEAIALLGNVTAEEIVGYIKAGNTGAYDNFGYSVALSSDGTTLAVGASGEASAATGINVGQSDNTASNAGAVYVFTRSGTAWSQQAYIKASNTGGGDRFGGSVALSSDGSTLAVGAYGETSAATGINGDQSDNTASNAGAVYVFTRSGTAWGQQAYIKASNTGGAIASVEALPCRQTGPPWRWGHTGKPVPPRASTETRVTTAQPGPVRCMRSHAAGLPGASKPTSKPAIRGRSLR